MICLRGPRYFGRQGPRFQTLLLEVLFDRFAEEEYRAPIRSKIGRGYEVPKTKSPL